MNVFVQNSRDPWCVDITSAVDPVTGATIDLRTVTSVDMFVHRGVTPTLPDGSSTETWTCTIDTTYAPATALTLRAIHTPTWSGSGSLLVAPETIKFRPRLSFASGPVVRCSQFSIPVVVE